MFCVFKMSQNVSKYHAFMTGVIFLFSGKISLYPNVDISLHQEDSRVVYASEYPSLPGGQTRVKYLVTSFACMKPTFFIRA